MIKKVLVALPLVAGAAFSELAHLETHRAIKAHVFDTKCHDYAKARKEARTTRNLALSSLLSNSHYTKEVK